jgi:hypothetical protein
MTIQVGMGATAGDEISLKSSLIRSKTLTIFGYGNLDASLDKRATAYRLMAELAG